jgi:hypothetical protein
MAVGWNYLYGFPGEQIEDYRAVLTLLPKLEHLHAPTGCSEIIIDRFSPYHTDPAQFGISAIEPFPSYRGLYPPDAPLNDIAYHFNGHYSTPLLADREFVATLRAAITRWQTLWSGSGPQPYLRAIDTGKGDVAIADTRRIAVDAMSIISRDADMALRHLERPRSRDTLPTELAAHIEELLERHFVVEHEGALLSVVTRPRTRTLERPRTAGPKTVAHAIC